MESRAMCGFGGDSAYPLSLPSHWVGLERGKNMVQGPPPQTCCRCLRGAVHELSRFFSSRVVSVYLSHNQAVAVLLELLLTHRLFLFPCHHYCPPSVATLFVHQPPFPFPQPLLPFQTPHLALNTCAQQGSPGALNSCSFRQESKSTLPHTSPVLHSRWCPGDDQLLLLVVVVTRT